MYKLIDSIFDFPHAKFEELTDERNEAMFNFLAERDYIAVFNEARSDLQVTFRAPLTRLSHEYLFANVFDKTGHRVRVPSLAAPKVVQVAPEDEFTADSAITIDRADLKELMFLKQRLIKKVQQVSSGSHGFWIKLDGKVVGMVEITSGQFDKFSAYMLSDLALPSRHKRMSKLVLMVTRSTEFWKYVERSLKMRVTEISTTAFTDKPVSMKYRGVYELHARKQNGDGEAFLQYKTVPSGLSLEQTYHDWFARHGNQIRSG